MRRDDMAEIENFRQRLDAVLRTLDVKKVSDFLIAEKQWSPGKPADPEFAMWMMIAGSPTLQDLHERARDWLVSHGHEEDAKTFLRSDKKQEKGKGKSMSNTKRRLSSR
jgi:hypothetical protein